MRAPGRRDRGGRPARRGGPGAPSAGMTGGLCEDRRDGGARPRPVSLPQGPHLIILGLILLVLGFALGIGILYTLGIILLLVGIVLYVLGSTNRAVGGRRHYY